MFRRGWNRYELQSISSLIAAASIVSESKPPHSVSVAAADLLLTGSLRRDAEIISGSYPSGPECRLSLG